MAALQGLLSRRRSFWRLFWWVLLLLGVFLPPLRPVGVVLASPVGAACSIIFLVAGPLIVPPVIVCVIVMAVPPFCSAVRRGLSRGRLFGLPRSLPGVPVSSFSLGPLPFLPVCCMWCARYALAFCGVLFDQHDRLRGALSLALSFASAMMAMVDTLHGTCCIGNA